MLSVEIPSGFFKSNKYDKLFPMTLWLTQLQKGASLLKWYFTISQEWTNLRNGKKLKQCLPRSDDIVVFKNKTSALKSTLLFDEQFSWIKSPASILRNGHQGTGKANSGWKTTGNHFSCKKVVVENTTKIMDIWNSEKTNQKRLSIWRYKTRIVSNYFLMSHLHWRPKSPLILEWQDTKQTKSKTLEKI